MQILKTGNTIAKYERTFNRDYSGEHDELLDLKNLPSSIGR